MKVGDVFTDTGKCPVGASFNRRNFGKRCGRGVRSSLSLHGSNVFTKGAHLKFPLTCGKSIEGGFDSLGHGSVKWDLQLCCVN